MVVIRSNASDIRSRKKKPVNYVDENYTSYVSVLAKVAIECMLHNYFAFSKGTTPLFPWKICMNNMAFHQSMIEYDVYI